MKISYDSEVDAPCIRFVEGKHEWRTVRLNEEVALNLWATTLPNERRADWLTGSSSASTLLASASSKPSSTVYKLLRLVV